MEPLEGATTIERMLLDRAKRTRTPANGSIEILPLCNMNCDMCYVRLSREEMEKLGDSIGVKIKCQKEEIFTSMHRI